MSNPTLLRQRLAALFLLGLLLWFSPLVLRVNQSGNVFGIPILYLYLFGVWVAIVAVAALILSRRGHD
ncbi:MAG: hypothetical protein WBM40_24055 [Thiohalocapsa sp.]|jgi:hypothetical protein